MGPLDLDKIDAKLASKAKTRHGKDTSLKAVKPKKTSVKKAEKYATKARWERTKKTGKPKKARDIRGLPGAKGEEPGSMILKKSKIPPLWKPWKASDSILTGVKGGKAKMMKVRDFAAPAAVYSKASKSSKIKSHHKAKVKTGKVIAQLGESGINNGIIGGIVKFKVGGIEKARFQAIDIESVRELAEAYISLQRPVLIECVATTKPAFGNSQFIKTMMIAEDARRNGLKDLVKEKTSAARKVLKSLIAEEMDHLDMDQGTYRRRILTPMMKYAQAYVARIYEAANVEQEIDVRVRGNKRVRDISRRVKAPTERSAVVQAAMDIRESIGFNNNFDHAFVGAKRYDLDLIDSTPCILEDEVAKIVSVGALNVLAETSEEKSSSKKYRHEDVYKYLRNEGHKDLSEKLKAAEEGDDTDWEPNEDETNIIENAIVYVLKAKKSN